MQPLDVRHAVTIGVDKRALAEIPTMDLNTVGRLKFKPEYRFLDYEEEKKKGEAGLGHMVPVLLDGNHRLQLLQKRLCKTHLELYQEALQGIEDFKMSRKSLTGIPYKEYQIRLEDCKNFLAEKGTWLAKVVDLRKSKLQSK